MWYGLGQRSKIRLALLRAQGAQCHYCSAFMVMTRGQINTVTIDHKVPSSKGGHNSTQNRVGACWQCNISKGDMSEEKFLDLLRTGHVVNMSPGGSGSSAAKKLRNRIAKQISKEIALAEDMTRGERQVLRQKFAQVIKLGDPKELAQYPELNEALAGWYFRNPKDQDSGKE